MAIIDMKKVLLIGLQSEREKILQGLQSMGNVQIVRIEEPEERENGDWYSLLEQNRNDDLLAEVEAQIAEIDFALGFIGKYSEQKRGLFAQKPEVGIDALRQALDKREEVLKIAGRCRELGDRLNEIRTQETRLMNIIAQMEPWKALDIPFEDIRDTVSVRLMAGSVDKGVADDFEESLRPDSMLPVYLERLGDDKEDIYYFLAYHKTLDEEILQKLKDFGFSKGNFAGLRGTSAEIIGECQRNLDGIKEEYRSVEQEASGLASHRRELELLYDAFSVERDRRSAALNLMETDQTFVLKGWIPADSTDSFNKKLTGITSNYYAEFEDPGPEEEFPVALKNHPLVEPFETVTNLYSVPNSRELDPNVFMAPFYAMFFGIMLGDAGYGLILAIAAYWANRKIKLHGDTGKLVRLMVLGGISAAVWGTVFGGWFGDAATRWGIPALLFNPMDEPIKMLLFCFALGIIHLFVGMGVQAYSSIRKGQIWDAVFDQGLWFVFYIGLILLAVGAVVGLNGMLQVGKITAIMGAVGLVLTQGRHKKNIIGKFLSGLLSLYNVTGFLSDVLSYSRLFALGLTTGVIGMVVNQLGGMLGGSWIGWIFAAIVLAGGHTFNIAINVLGSYVHASRLQYIEFYGKFYEGGGKAFNPLMITTKYSQVKQTQE